MVPRTQVKQARKCRPRTGRARDGQHDLQHAATRNTKRRPTIAVDLGLPFRPLVTKGQTDREPTPSFRRRRQMSGTCRGGMSTRDTIYASPYLPYGDKHALGPRKGKSDEAGDPTARSMKLAASTCRPSRYSASCKTQTQTRPPQTMNQCTVRRVKRKGNTTRYPPKRSPAPGRGRRWPLVWLQLPATQACARRGPLGSTRVRHESPSFGPAAAARPETKTKPRFRTDGMGWDQAKHISSHKRTAALVIADSNGGFATLSSHRNLAGSGASNARRMATHDRNWSRDWSFSFSVWYATPKWPWADASTICGPGSTVSLWSTSLAKASWPQSTASASPAADFCRTPHKVTRAWAANVTSPRSLAVVTTPYKSSTSGWQGCTGAEPLVSNRAT